MPSFYPIKKQLCNRAPKAHAKMVVLLFTFLLENCIILVKPFAYGDNGGRAKGLLSVGRCVNRNRSIPYCKRFVHIYMAQLYCSLRVLRAKSNLWLIFGFWRALKYDWTPNSITIERLKQFGRKLLYKVVQLTQKKFQNE